MNCDCLIDSSTSCLGARLDFHFSLAVGSMGVSTDHWALIESHPLTKNSMKVQIQQMSESKFPSQWLQRGLAMTPWWVIQCLLFFLVLSQQRSLRCSLQHASTSQRQMLPDCILLAEWLDDTVTPGEGCAHSFPQICKCVTLDSQGTGEEPPPLVES